MPNCVSAPKTLRTGKVKFALTRHMQSASTTELALHMTYHIVLHKKTSLLQPGPRQSARLHRESDLQLSTCIVLLPLVRPASAICILPAYIDPAGHSVVQSVSNAKTSGQVRRTS